MQLGATSRHMFTGIPGAHSLAPGGHAHAPCSCSNLSQRIDCKEQQRHCPPKVAAHKREHTYEPKLTEPQTPTGSSQELYPATVSRRHPNLWSAWSTLVPVRVPRWARRPSFVRMLCKLRASVRLGDCRRRCETHSPSRSFLPLLRERRFRQ